LEQATKTARQSETRKQRLAELANERNTYSPPPQRTAEPPKQAALADAGTAAQPDAALELTDASVPPDLEAWLGRYQGSDVTRYVMEGQPERNFDDAKAVIRVEKLGKSQLHFVFVDSSNGQDLCTILGDVTGDEARLPGGQRCFVEPDEDMSVSSRPGTARRNGNQLTLNLVLDTILDLEELHAEGRIEYEFDGQKQ
jgi:hypothetical protein